MNRLLRYYWLKKKKNIQESLSFNIDFTQHLLVSEDYKINNYWEVLLQSIAVKKLWQNFEYTTHLKCQSQGVKTVNS